MNIIQDWGYVLKALKTYQTMTADLLENAPASFNVADVNTVQAAHDFVSNLRSRLQNQFAQKKLTHSAKNYPWTEEERLYLTIALTDLLDELEKVLPATKDSLSSHFQISSLASTISKNRITSSSSFTYGLNLREVFQAHTDTIDAYEDAFKEDLPYALTILSPAEMVQKIQDCLNQNTPFPLEAIKDLAG